MRRSNHAQAALNELQETFENNQNIQYVMRKRCLQICAAITRQNVNISDALYLMNAIPTLFVPTHDVTIESVRQSVDR